MLKQVLRGKASCNAIAQSRGMSHHTVRRWRDVAIAEKLTESDVDNLTDSDLIKIFQSGRVTMALLAPDWQFVEEQLAKGYTLLEIHQEYEDQANGRPAMAYSTFCQKFNKEAKQKPVFLRQNHVAGEEMQTDFAGYRPEGIEYGNRRKFELFVTALPASHYLFAIITRSQSTTDHIEAYIAAIEFFGGVPTIAVPDNLKAAVIKPGRHGKAIINRSLIAVGDYYGFIVEPARPRRPQDKPSVEIGVKLIQRVLRIRLGNLPPQTLHEMNKIVLEIVSTINNRKMRRGNETRQERFDRLDKNALQPLPAQRIEFIDLPIDRRVQQDYHVQFDNAYYSVPWQIAGEIVWIRGSSRSVEIRHDGQVVAVHPRSYTPVEYITNEQHRPQEHRDWLASDFEDWRSNLCEDLQELVDIAMHRNPNAKREKRRVIDRVRRLEKQYKSDRLCAAIAVARQGNALSFRHVENILRNNVDANPDVASEPVVAIKPVNNVRGPAYFAAEIARRHATSAPHLQTDSCGSQGEAA